jgi:hypothetical protein
VFCISFCLLASQHFVLTSLFVNSLHNIMQFSLTACCNLHRLETRPLAKILPPCR